MRLGLLALLILGFFYKGSAQKSPTDFIIADLHNDVLSAFMVNGTRIERNLKGIAHTDLARLKKGGVGIQFFSVFSNEKYGHGRAFKYAIRQLDSLDACVKRNPGLLQHASSDAEIDQALQDGKIAVLKGVEGGHMIEEKLEHLDSFYNRGVRYLTLTWNNSVSWASSAADESKNKFRADKKGLNEFGKELVRKMNEMGMMVDVSHVGEKTFQDVIAASTKPVIASHSSVYKLCPHPRNLKDDQIRAIGKNGGVIFVNFFSGFLDPGYEKRKTQLDRQFQPQIDSLKKLNRSSYTIDEWLAATYPGRYNELRPGLSVLIDHIDYIVKMIGIDHVGLGSDFDGIPSAPLGLDGVENFQKIAAALKQRGYIDADIRKITSENFRRVFKEVTD